MVQSKSNKIIIWILLLTLTAGYTNILSIHAIAIPSAHMTGNLSNLSYNVFHGNMIKAGFILLFLFLFFLGGIASGYFFVHRKIEEEISYGTLFIVIGIIIIALEMIINVPRIIAGITAFTLGVQNGLNIVYNNMPIRTTHMTGYITDAGKLIGNFIHGKNVDFKKLRYLLLAIAAYSVGGFFAIYISLWRIQHYFYEVGIIYILLGIYYIVLIHKKPNITQV